MAESDPFYQYTFNCDECKYHTNFLDKWKRHSNTNKHIRGGKNTIYQCNLCDYSNANRLIFNMHVLNQHASSDVREKDFPYYCKKCDYGTFVNSAYSSHLNTKKHLRLNPI
jgi:hypothetical protein